MTILSELLTQILIPAAAVVGIAFALFQWFIVSRISVSASSSKSRSSDNGRDDYLLEDASHDERELVTKCAEIQEAISLGMLSLYCIDSGG